MGVDEPDLPTLFEWAGGRGRRRRLIDAFYDRVEADDLLGALLPRRRLRACTARTSQPGGPRCWAGRPTTPSELGGYEAMLAHHRDLAITAAQRHRFASTMSLAADDAGLPDDAEFRAAIIGYLEWGTRLAMHNSQPGAERRRACAGAPMGMGRGSAVARLTPPPPPTLAGSCPSSSVSAADRGSRHPGTDRCGRSRRPRAPRSPRRARGTHRPRCPVQRGR